MAKPVIGVKTIWACVLSNKLPYSITSYLRHLFCNNRLATGVQKYDQTLVHGVPAEMEAEPIADQPVMGDKDFEELRSEYQAEAKLNQATSGEREKKGTTCMLDCQYLISGNLSFFLLLVFIDILLFPCTCFCVAAIFFCIFLQVMMKPVKALSKSVQAVCASVASRSDKMRGETKIKEDTSSFIPAGTEPVSNEHNQTCTHSVSAEGAAKPLPRVNDRPSTSRDSEYQSKQRGGKKGDCLLD